MQRLDLVYPSPRQGVRRPLRPQIFGAAGLADDDAATLVPWPAETRTEAPCAAAATVTTPDSTKTAVSEGWASTIQSVDLAEAMAVLVRMLKSSVLVDWTMFILRIPPKRESKPFKLPEALSTS